MIRDFFQHYKWDGRPWLICGMGPTFSQRKDFDLTQYNILGINKVCREIWVDLCQIIDYYIIGKVSDGIYQNAKALVVPFYPHFHCRPWFDLEIENLVRGSKLLQTLHSENRLFAFNLSTYTLRKTSTPLVRAKFFSAEASVSLLANLGVKEIRLLGVDGGSERASEFSDHGPCDPRGFDLQWKGINRTITEFNLNVQHLVRNPDGLYSHQETKTDATV